MNRDAPHRHRPTRVAKCLRKLFGVSFSNAGIVIIVLMYLIFGGFLFQYVENKRKIDNRTFFRKHRDQCIHELWTITKSAHVLYKQNWTLEALDPMRKFEMNVIKEMNLNHKILVRTWSFSDSLIYSVTILTTIGYNNHTPNTSSGKIATIIYATFGIPLMLLCICNVGYMVSDFLQYGKFYSSFRYEYGTPQIENSIAPKEIVLEGPAIVKRNVVVTTNKTRNNRYTSDVRHLVLDPSATKSNNPKNSTKYDGTSTIPRQNNCALCDECNKFDINCDWCKRDMRRNTAQLNQQQSTNQIITRQLKQSQRNFWYPITFAVFLLILYVCIGAFVYSIWKDVPFGDCIYFWFLNLSTIGSCDILQNTFANTNEFVDLLFYSLYLLIGLILTTTVILLVQKNAIKLELFAHLPKYRERRDEVAL